MPQHPPAWYDAQYNNRGRIPEHMSILQQWADRSAAARDMLGGALDIPYGGTPAQTLDVFSPPGASGAPVLVHIHGGYWRALDKKDHSFVVPPFVRAGAVVVVPNHTLAPAVGVADIVLELVQALAWVHRHIAAHGGDPARIVVSGHSAGGHLAAMMLACEWPRVAPDLPPQVLHAALAISGVFDLEPLRHAPFLAPDLRLDAASARRLSPARMPAPTHGTLAAIVGGDESEEFLRQNLLIRRAWGPRGVPVCEAVAGRHHMNVLHDLAEPGTRLHGLARGLLGLGP